MENLYTFLIIVSKYETYRSNFNYDSVSVIPPDLGRQPHSQHLLSSEEPFSPLVRVPNQQGPTEEANLCYWTTRDNKITRLLLTTGVDSASKMFYLFFLIIGKEI